MNKTILSISKMAKLANVSVETLKHYDKIGIFKPANINPETSYRYYSIDQLYKICLIRDLRNLGFSLAEVKEYIDDVNVDSSIKNLQKRIDKMHILISQMETQIKETECRLRRILAYKDYPVYQSSFTEKYLDERKVITLGTEVSTSEETYLAVNSMERMLRGDTPEFTSSLFGMIIREEQLLLDERKAILFALENKDVDINYPPDYIKTLPAGKYICGIFNGKIEDNNKSLQCLIDHIRKTEYMIAGDAVLISIIDSSFTSHESELLYEIQVPVEHEH